MNRIKEICPYCGSYMKVLRTDPPARFSEDNNRIRTCSCDRCHAVVDFLVTPHTTVKQPLEIGEKEH